MAIHWQIKFRSFRANTLYTVSIYDDAYTGNIPIQLKGATHPFETGEDVDQDIYKPIRNQSGYIRFIAEDASIVSEMMPSNPTDRSVVLKDDSDNVCWAGFLSNEQYSQGWEPCPYEVEIPIMSVMMAMRGVEFTQSEGYTSLLSLLNTIDSYLPFTTEMVVPSDIPVWDVFVNNNNFREFLTVPERAERGTTAMYECKYIYDCVEEFCKYFGLSLHEYNGIFYFLTHDAVEYDNVDLSGNTRTNQHGTVTIEYLTVCGSDNHIDYSQAFRRIIGTFNLNRKKAEEVFSLSENFFKLFSVEGYYNQNLLFYGNSEILAYKNGTQQTSWITAQYDYGGQIIRHREDDDNVVLQDGYAWNDYFYINSKKVNAGTPSRAIVFNIPNYIYINSGEYTALNINCSVNAWYSVTQGGDFIKRLHCKVKVGNYWLKSEYPSTAGGYTQYTWSATETTCWLLIDNGKVTMKNAISTIYYRAEAQMDKITGFSINMPSLSAGYHSVYMELLCNNENTEDFNQYSDIGYLVSDLEINVLRAVNSVTSPTPDLDSNTILRFNDIIGEDYSVDSIISTKRGTQFGTGAAINSSHAYITTKYDELGIIRRKNAMGASKEILTIDVRRNAQPNEYVNIGNNSYDILSQSIDWRDDVNKIILRKR